MYSLYHDNRNKCVSLIPHFDECCNYYMDKGLHVDGKLFDEVGLVSSVVGDIKMSVRSTDYEGWLVCDGRAVSRTTYSALYELIGTSFGNVDVDTFNLPNAQGRVLGSVTSNNSTNNLSIRCVGDLVGAETHTLTVRQMPTHAHGVTDPLHNHGVTDPQHNHGVTEPQHNHGVTDPSHAHGYVNQVGDQDTDNAFGTETAADQVDYNQTTSFSTTGISINNALTNISINDAFTDISINNNLTGISINDNGSSEAHNNMQPTLFIGNTFIYCGVKNSSSEFNTPCNNSYVIPPCLQQIV